MTKIMTSLFFTLMESIDIIGTANKGLGILSLPPSEVVLDVTAQEILLINKKGFS